MPLQLAAPHVAGTGESILAYVERVFEWADLLDSPAIELLKSERLEGLLWEAGLFPRYETIAELLLHGDVEFYSAIDVFTVINRLLARASSLEATFDIKDMLLKDTVLDPEIRGHSAEVDREIERIVGIMLRAEAETSCVRILCGSERSDHGGMPLSSSTNMLGFERHPNEFFGETGALTGMNHLCYRVEDIHSHADVVALWTASGEHEPECRIHAIRVTTWRLARALSKEMHWDETDRIQIHGEFLEYCRTHNFDDDPRKAERLLRACAETVLGIDTDTHPLRSTGGGDSPQRVRNEDTAWRRKIDRDFRLHYWRLPGSRFEFAAIDTHHHFGIPD
jgi:hypothetical protein